MTRAATGAVGIALIGGGIAVATPATASPSVAAASSVAQEWTLAVTGGLGYTPGEPTMITGTAKPFASVNVYGGSVDATVRAEANGGWAAAASVALNGEAQEVHVSSAGQSLMTWTKPGNGDGIAPEDRELAVTSDLSGFVPGESRTISGVARDHAEVSLVLLNPGERPVPGAQETLTGRADEHGNWSIEVDDNFRTEGYLHAQAAARRRSSSRASTDPVTAGTRSAFRGIVRTTGTRPVTAAVRTVAVLSERGTADSLASRHLGIDDGA